MEHSLSNTVTDLSTFLNEKKVKEGIYSKTMLKNEYFSVVIMHLAKGEDLSAHASSHPVLISIHDGTGQLHLNKEIISLKPGILINLEPHQIHSVVSHDYLVFSVFFNKAIKG